MLDWLQAYYGAVVAIIAILGGLWVLAERLEKKLEQHRPFRAWVANGLIMPSWHDSYRDWLGRQLERLQGWMGGPWSGTALARCLAIAFAYPVLLMLAGYGLGGPGTIGRTEFLPALGDWRRPVLGFGLLVVMVALGLVMGFSARIDGSLETAIAARLEQRDVADPQRWARWLYRLGGASAAASLWIAVAFHAGFSVAIAFAVAVAGAVAAAVAVAGAVAVAFAGAVAGAVAGAFAGAGAGAVAVAGFVAVAVVLAGAFARAFVGAFALAVAGAVFIAGAFAVAVDFAGAGAGAFAGALAVGGAFALAVAFAGAFAGSFFVFVNVAVAIAGAVRGAFAGARPVAAAAASAVTLVSAVAVAFAIAVALAGAMISLGGIGPFPLVFFLFFAILPVFNTLLDWPSWAISRWLAHDLHDLMRGETRRLGRWLQRVFRRGWQPVAFAVHIAADLVAALAMLLALAAMLPFVIQMFNRLVVPALPLDDFLKEAYKAPWPNAVWPLAMLLTTLIPTLLHAGALIVGLFLWLIQPTDWRKDIVKGLRGNDAWAATRASWLLILTLIAAGLLVVLLAFGLVRLIGLIEPVGLLLLDAAHLGIAAADALAARLP